MGKAGLNLKQVPEKVPTPRTLELLAFDENCRFGTPALFGRIKRALVYPPKPGMTTHRDFAEHG